MTFVPARVEVALARIEAHADPAARALAEEAVSSVLELHAEALRRVKRAFPDGERLLRAAAAEDELVASVLLLHGLHPVPLAERVALAAADLGRAGVEIEILGAATDGVLARVRGSEAVRRRAEAALREAAPEVDRVEVVTLPRDVVPIEALTKTRRDEHERCSLCAAPASEDHPHLFDVQARRLVCACASCSILFDGQSTKLRRVVPKVVRLDDVDIDDDRWAALAVPVGLAFFFHASVLGKMIAAYPGPAGAVESEVPAEAWDALVASVPVLGQLAPDLEALLVDRLGPAPRCLIVSIDHAYALTGIVRCAWQGLTGGKEPGLAACRFIDRLLEAAP